MDRQDFKCPSNVLQERRNSPLSADRLQMETVAYVFRFQAGDSHAKVSHFLTHDAITGFTSQILRLPAYARKTGSSTAIKLAPGIHQNLPFCAQKSKNILGIGQISLPR